MFFFCSNEGFGWSQSLGRGLGGDGGDTVLLEVGGHGGVAAQSLAGALQRPVALHDPGAAAGLLGQHITTTAAAGRGSGRRRHGHGGGEVRAVALQHGRDVVEQVAEELRDALITCRGGGGGQPRKAESSLFNHGETLLTIRFSPSILEICPL